MLYKRMKKRRSSELLKKSILERSGCFRTSKHHLEATFPAHCIAEKNLKRCDITYISVFSFLGTFRCTSRETDAVKFACTRFVVKLGSHAVSDTNSFHYASSLFMFVRSTVPTPLIESRLRLLRMIPAAAGRSPQWTWKVLICYLHPFLPSPLYHLPFAASVISAGLTRAELDLQECWIFLPRPNWCSRRL
jgi:hypothetical protein